MAELNATEVAKLAALPAAASVATISGSPTANQLAFWSSASALAASANGTWDGTTFKINATMALGHLGTPGAQLHLAVADTTDFAGAVHALSPNIVNGRRVVNRVGKAASTGNVGEWYWKHVGDNNSGNYIGFSFFGVRSVVHIVQNGDVAMGGTLDDSAAGGLTGATLVALATGRVGVGAVSPGAAFDVGGKFWVDTNGNLTKLNNVTYTWPSTQGGVGTTLTNDGSGILTWSTAGNLSGTGSTNFIPYYTASTTLGNNGNFTLSGAPNSNVLSINTDVSPSLSISARLGSGSNSIKLSGSTNDVYMFATQSAGLELAGTGAGDFGFRDFLTNRTFWVGPGFQILMTSGSRRIQIADGASAGVSSAGFGALRYNDALKLFQFSADGAAYVSLASTATANVTGSGAADRLAVWSSASALTSSSTLTYTSSTLIASLASVGTGTSRSIEALNATAAAAGAQQYSPLLSLVGQGWKTDATAASQSVEFALQTRPVQGSANPTGALAVLVNVNSGGYTSRWEVSTEGAVLQTMAALGSNLTRGLTLFNATLAAAGVQQFSPALSLTGNGWKTDATAASQTVEFGMQTQPVQGTSAPTGILMLYTNINAGSNVSVWEITSAGNATNHGKLTVENQLIAQHDINMTDASKRLAFFGATLQTQFNSTGSTAGFTAGGGNPAFDNSTWTGNTGSTAYTTDDIVKAMKQYGLMAA